MTRDDVLEEAANALASEAVEDAMACLSDGPAIVRKLKSKPPEKSPEVRGDPERGTNLEIVTSWRDRMGHMFMLPIELASLGNVLWDAADLPKVRAERDALKAQLEATTNDAFERAARYCGTLAAGMERGAGETAPGGRLRQCEREIRAMKTRPAMLVPEGSSALRAELDELREDRDGLRSQLEATERRAKEALARVEALTAEVKHREWVDDGAKMKGEA